MKRQIPEKLRKEAMPLVESYLHGTPTERNSALDEVLDRAGEDGSTLLLAMWDRMEKLGHEWDGDIELLLQRVTDRGFHRVENGTLRNHWDR
jgi:hypothetical protein